MSATAKSVLVLGGARSGKSTYAESLVEASGRTPVYVATAGPARDGEMADRIAHHRARRGDHWRTVDAPLELAEALLEASGPDTAILLDCATLWLSNLLEAGTEPDRAVGILAETLARLPGPVVVVSNEVGSGIVPANALARAFRDHHGRMNQRLAAAMDHVVLVVAGRALVLPKSPSPEIVL
ncbi:adenosylcobinamide kinase/adenosylcobinamide-phosphate guanylyltransferase [Amorphus suaedae]